MKYMRTYVLVDFLTTIHIQLAEVGFGGLKIKLHEVWRKIMSRIRTELEEKKIMGANLIHTCYITE